MRPCTGCRHLVRRTSGRGLCRWPERHGEWHYGIDPLTERLRPEFHHADGTVEKVAVWRPEVQRERALGGRCGPEARNYEPNLWRRLLARVTGRRLRDGATE